MLELVNLSFKVDDDGNKKEILNDVSLTLEDGKFLVITGPNGGGKSTLAKLIMGIEKPTGGKILWNGTDITDMSITERAKLGIGYAFQQPPRFKGLTVRDLLSLAHGDTLPEDQCCTYLTSVGLCSKDYLNREVDATLSGGEIKRIEIATIMARNVDLAIYDEPEAGIDLWSFNMLIESFKRISNQNKQSMIIISHQERIMKIADEIAIIANGTVKKKGPQEEVFPLLMNEFNNVCDFR
jgi:Fe-S cluster assembly ATP-binding protein